jgi:hypothetical protein
MKKTQTIVDREHLSSGYIESKQNFSTVLSQVKQLPTTPWKNPWFYGPIGIAVFTVTISIVSLNPSSASISASEPIEQKESLPILSTKIDAPSVAIQPTEVKKDNSFEPINQFSIENKPVVQPNLAVSIQENLQEKQEVEAAIEVKKQAAELGKVAADNRYPHVNGYFTGEIPLNHLFSEKGIQLNPTIQVTSFDFNFFNGKSNVVKAIKGNSIPEELQFFIESHNVGKMIFITNIKAIDEYKREFTLPSINYKPIKGN